ncbi:MAG: bifunctional hydroxymethylpyrimidine kinase/phosphomethylpyrimidine kinase [Magnetospirillum sp. WYHS-4]
MKGRVLIVAGSDSGGGAGIQADVKTVTALGGYAMTAITALTAQNTRGVFGIHEVPADFVARQMILVLDDIGADAVKLGMLHRAPVIEAVADVLEARTPGIPLVLDPVMVAKGGALLLQDEAVAALKRRLLPLATLLTPNLPEAEVLAGHSIATPDEAARAAVDLSQANGGRAVLLKGGHLPGTRLVDILAEGGAVIATFEQERIDSGNTHGTGCTLASAIATGLAQGMAVGTAVARARRYVIEAIRTAPGFGHGHGPLNHGHTIRPFTED